MNQNDPFENSRLGLLRRTGLFAGIDPAVVAGIAAEMDYISIQGGKVLFDVGDPGDALYLVCRGCLAVFEPDADGRMRFIAEVAAGETVGELSLITERRRQATVAAIRDSELWRISRATFDRLGERHPQALAALLRFVVARLDRIIHNERSPHPLRSFALVPVGPGVPAARFAVNLSAALNKMGRFTQILSDDSRHQPIEWFHRVEADSNFVLYQADPALTPWTRLCLRQADRILLLGAIDAEPPQEWPVPLEAGPFEARRELILLRENGEPPLGRAARWLEGQPDLIYHHLRLGISSDFDRLARLMTDNGIGIVLAGGGARGFAHLGVLRALTQSGVPIDRVGGTSMGAIVAAGVAAGWDDRRLHETFRRGFVEQNPLGDYTMPFVSLFGGRKVVRLLRMAFGERQIEDLERQFFCVSANLTAGRAEVHRRGSLWQWLRASVSLPGVLPPVTHGGQIFVDGGVIDNLPIDAMRALGPGLVMGVDIVTEGAISVGEDMEDPWSGVEFLRRMLWRRKDNLPLPSIVGILLRAALVSSDAAAARQRQSADLVFRPPTGGIDLLDWQSYERVIEIGYRHAMERLEAAHAEPIAERLFPAETL